MRDTVVTSMAALRETGDQIELIVPHAIWPLPTYREMLFVK
jgi:glutamine synthetase